MPQGVLRPDLSLNIKPIMAQRKSRMHPRRAPPAAAPQGSARGSAGGSAGGPVGSGGRLWLYGLHAVRAALQNPARRRQRLLLTPEAARALGPPSGPPPEPEPEIVSAAELARRLPAGAVHQGLALAVAPLAPAELEVACAPRHHDRDLVVVLDQVSDPRNVGAVLRAAAAFGARALVVPRRHSAPESGALAKAASGALEIVPLVRVTNLARALEELKDLGYWCLGLEPRARATLAEAAVAGDVALVLGAEGKGLRRLSAARCDRLARLAASEAMPSLNVASAAAVALYELVRPR